MPLCLLLLLCLEHVLRHEPVGAELSLSLSLTLTLTLTLLNLSLSRLMCGRKVFRARLSAVVAAGMGLRRRHRGIILLPLVQRNTVLANVLDLDLDIVAHRLLSMTMRTMVVVLALARVLAQRRGHSGLVWLHLDFKIVVLGCSRRRFLRTGKGRCGAHGWCWRVAVAGTSSGRSRRRG